jgi:hypothetical protein
MNSYPGRDLADILFLAYISGSDLQQSHRDFLTETICLLIPLEFFYRKESPLSSICLHIQLFTSTPTCAYLFSPLGYNPILYFAAEIASTLGTGTLWDGICPFTLPLACSQFSISLHSSTTRCPRLTLYLPYPSHGVNAFSQEPSQTMT